MARELSSHITEENSLLEKAAYSTIIYVIRKMYVFIFLK